MNFVIPITYVDSFDAWPILGSEISKRNLLKHIELQAPDSNIPLKELPISFTPTVDWDAPLEDLFSKPFLGIYIIMAPSFEYYRREIKDHFRAWSLKVSEHQVEWVALYIPTTSDFDKSMNKHYLKAYEKIAGDIDDQKLIRLYSQHQKSFLSLPLASESDSSYWHSASKVLETALSKGILVRIHQCAEHIMTLEDNGDFYKFCLAKESLAIIYEMCGLHIHAKECYDELRAPSEIFSIMDFVPVSVQDTKRTEELDTMTFRSLMQTGSISELSFREYVFNRQKALLQFIGEFAKIGELALNFVSMCMRLFSCLPDGNIVGSDWIYKVTYRLGGYLQDSVGKITNLEMKSNVHYAVGLLLSIARSRLERLGRSRWGDIFSAFSDFTPDFSVEKSPVRIEGLAKTPNSSYRENEEPQGDWPLSDTSSSSEEPEGLVGSPSHLERKLLELASSLCEEQSLSGYNRVADRYRAEYGIMLSLKNHYEQAAGLLCTLSLEKWPSLHSCILKHRLQCYLNLQRKHEALETAISLLRTHDLLDAQLWRCVEEISTSPEQLCCDGLFQAHLTLYAGRIKLGERIDATCLLFNPLSCDLSLVDIFADFSGIAISSGNTNLKPGSNEIFLSGTALVKGKLSASKLYLHVNNVRLYMSIDPQRLLVEDQEKAARIKQKIPALLVVNEVQLLAIEISVKREQATDCALTFNDSNLLFNKQEAEFLITNADGSSSSHMLLIENSVVKIPDLPADSKSFIILQIQATNNVHTVKETSFMGSPRIPSYESLMSMTTHYSFKKDSLSRRLNIYSQDCRFEATFSYSLSFSQESEESFSELSFIQPLRVTCKLSRKAGNSVLQAVILNCAHLPLKINEVEVLGCTIIEECFLQPAVIRTGQQLHVAFALVLQSSPRLVIHYCCATRKTENPGRIHVEASVDHKMRHQQFKYQVPFMMQEAVEMRHSGKSIVGEEFSVHLSFFSKALATIRVDSSPVWSVPDLFEGVVDDEVELKLVPKRNGPWDIPDIYVWVGDKRITVHGSRRVMCYSNTTRSEI